MRKAISISLIFIFFASPVLAMAATVTYMEAGTDETGDFTLFSSGPGNTGVSGIVVSATDQSHTGQRSIKFSSGATSGGGAFDSLGGIASDTGTRITFWIRASSIDNGNEILRVGNSSAQSVFSLRFNGSNSISINNGGGVTLGTDGTRAISTNTWTRITCSYTVTNTTTFNIKVFINGVADANASSGTLLRTGSDRISLQMSANTTANKNMWFDDIYVDNGTGVDDPGDIRITAKRPVGNGALNQWTTQIGSGGSGYGSGHAPQVNEIPLSTINGWSIQNASTQTEEYSIESPSVGDVDLSNHPIVAYMGWTLEKVGSASTGNIIVNGVATNESIGTTYSTFIQAVTSASYPSGNNAIGADTNGVNQLFSLAEAGVLFAFRPAVLHKIFFKNFFKFLLNKSASKFKFIFN